MGAVFCEAAPGQHLFRMNQAMREIAVGSAVHGSKMVGRKYGLFDDRIAEAGKVFIDLAYNAFGNLVP